MKKYSLFIVSILFLFLTFTTNVKADILDGKDDFPREFPIDITDNWNVVNNINNFIDYNKNTYPYYMVSFDSSTPQRVRCMVFKEPPDFTTVENWGSGYFLVLGHKKNNSYVNLNCKYMYFNLDGTYSDEVIFIDLLTSVPNTNCILYNNYPFHVFENNKSNKIISYYGVIHLPLASTILPSTPEYTDKPTTTTPTIPEAPTTWNVLDWLKYIVDWIKYLPTGFAVNIAPLFSPLHQVVSSLFKENTSLWDLVKSISNIVVNPSQYIINPLIELISPLFNPLVNIVNSLFKDDMSIWDLVKSIANIVINPLQFIIDPFIDRLSPLFNGLKSTFDLNPFRDMVDLFNSKFAFVQTVQNIYNDLYSTLVTNAYTQAPSITFDFSEVQGMIKVPTFSVTLSWFLRFKPYTDTVISVWLVINYIKGLFFGLPNLINGVSSDVKGVS